MITSANDFKLVQAHLAGAVTIITTRDADGCPRGFTATSFCSLSLEPPLVLFCLDTSADCFETFMNSNLFAVNILSEHQRDLSRLFATKGIAKYQRAEFEQGCTGMPLIPNCLAYLECSVETIYPGGDHRIIVGLVRYGQFDRDGRNGQDGRAAQPLLYYTRAYGTFAESRA